MEHSQLNSAIKRHAFRKMQQIQTHLDVLSADVSVVILPSCSVHHHSGQFSPAINLKAPITIRRVCAAPCTSARTRGARKTEMSDERGEWIVESADTWHKRKREPSDERVKEKGHVGSVSKLFFLFTNSIRTLKCDNFLVKHPFVIPFAPARSL
jgi:hypothetical protein